MPKKFYEVSNIISLEILASEKIGAESAQEAKKKFAEMLRDPEYRKGVLESLHAECDLIYDSDDIESEECDPMD